jgi:hypothetical protein
MADPDPISIDDITSAVHDALVTAVGLGILGFNHLQVQRREVSTQVGAVVRAVSETVSEQVDRLAGER